tara:strand:- start:979 stop:1233 length:255 start_codon:yes stop_codon:yes gene_type:complete
MDEPLDRDLLVRILDMVDLDPAEMIRRGDAFDLLNVDSTSLDDPAIVVDLIAAHPGLMQRPIAILGGRAVVARPADRILELLDA